MRSESFTDERQSAIGMLSMENKQIPLMIPSIGEEEIRAVETVLRSGFLVQGEEVSKLEKHFCNYLGCKNAVAVSNGTASLHLALTALGVGREHEVIVPAFSHIATANAVELVGAKPVFVDINLDTFNINTDLIEGCITSRTKAIIPVHEFGLCCDMNPIMSLAKKYDLHVIEDAACGLGATDNDKNAGTFGDVGSFSLHPRKLITSGEGGVVTTEEPELAEKFAILRNHGSSLSNGVAGFVEAGFNYRLTDIQAALANEQFKRIDEILARKNLLAELYCDNIRNSKITLPKIPKGKGHSWQTFHVMLDKSINRDESLIKLKSKGIYCNYGAQCIPAESYYREKYGYKISRQYPEAWNAYTQGIALPMYERLSEEDIFYISDELNLL